MMMTKIKTIVTLRVVEDRVANPYLGSVPSRLLGMIVVIMIIIMIRIFMIGVVSLIFRMILIMAALTVVFSNSNGDYDEFDPTLR